MAFPASETESVPALPTPSLDERISLVGRGGQQPTIEQIVDSIKEYYFDKPTPDNFDIRKNVEALFRTPNKIDLRLIFSLIYKKIQEEYQVDDFDNREKGVLASTTIKDSRGNPRVKWDDVRLQTMIVNDAQRFRRTIDFSFIQQLTELMSMSILHQQRSNQLKLDEEREKTQSQTPKVCPIKGGNIKKQMKKSYKRRSSSKKIKRRLRNKKSYKRM